MSSPMKWTSLRTLLLAGSFLLWFILPVAPVSSSDDWSSYCGNETFPKYGRYEKTLNNIAEMLPAQVSLAPSYFHPLSSSSERERIYAAGLCREDSSPTDCEICIRKAFQGVGVRCPFSKVAAIVYERCSLWMSNREFVAQNFNGISFLRYNSSRAPVEREILGESVVGLVWAVAAETAKSAARFATAKQQIIGAANGYTVYAFAQCIPIVSRDCKLCLDGLIHINKFLPTSVGGESASLSCQFRWELYPFITGVTPMFITVVTPTATEGNHGSSSEHEWKRKFFILSAVGSAVLAILIVSTLLVQWWRHSSRTTPASEYSSTTTPAGERLERVETTSLEKKCLETGEGSSSKVPETPKPMEQPIGDACARMDLSAIHEILVRTHYNEDEGSTELSFEGWTQQARDLLGARKRGDSAFACKRFRIAIHGYTEFVDVGTTVSPTVYARRSLCYLMCDQPEAALRDAILAQTVKADWPTALYMQSVALSMMDMHSDAMNILNEASQLEEMRRQKNTEIS